MRQQVKRQNGYVALMSAIIVSAALLMITFTLGLSGFFSRFDELNTEFKERSIALAETCGDTALLKLAANESISTPFIVSVGSDSCTIVSVISSAGQTTIKTKAVIQNVVTNIKIVANNADTSVVSWEEIPTL